MPNQWKSHCSALSLLHHWHAAVDKHQSVRSVFVDFSKAFDHVDHNILVAKLSRWVCLMSSFGECAPSCETVDSG